MTDKEFQDTIAEHWPATPSFDEFVKTLTDWQLVAMQAEARKVGDQETLKAVLVELGRRQKPQGEGERDDKSFNDTSV
jgi:hypothetical protein